ncbi:LptF/LptG family permease [uncultured Alistipes sp.]|uniref:LptF/LptG family permease n=1 Tax=uncultured Alistipes sp. TaxID=538949 RepID=UPI00261A166D|nr:LptF/LptG family permease [uncultured Alistipes sp.]
MKTIHKLVLKSYLGPMILTFFIVMFVLMMNFVWRYIDELVGKGLDAGVIIELMCYAMANMIPMGLPLSMLLAAIMTMGNLGENYELLAMKSAGMSLPQILKPLIIVVGIVSIGSFFVVNNLVPYANKKMLSILYDIRQQKQVIEFQDGLFFNGIEDMSIRVGKQDPKTHLLRDVLIYDNRNANGNMTTTVADSGYIRLSDNKKYLYVTLYNGETYEQTRNYQWYNNSALRHHIFEKQDGIIPMDGFDFERSNSDAFSNSTTKNIAELDRAIDSLDQTVNAATTRSYEPLLKEQIFSRDNQVLPLPDSLKIDKSGFKDRLYTDSLMLMPLRDKDKVWGIASSNAKNSRGLFSFDESTAKEALNQLYRSQIEWHRKISLPFSIMIFFLIGAPLGAIIRKGGLGTPIVISVIFFVIYYIISISGEKAAREGNWDAFYGMWLSSFILAPIAVYLTYKATNDSVLLDTDWYAGRIKHYMEKWGIHTPAWWKKRSARIRCKHKH